MAQLRLRDILQGSEDELGLKQIVGEAGLSRSTSSIRVQRYEEAEGFWNRIIPDVILVVTPSCVSELKTLPPESSKKIFQAIISNRIPCIAVFRSRESTRSIDRSFRVIRHSCVCIDVR